MNKELIFRWDQRVATIIYSVGIHNETFNEIGFLNLLHALVSGEGGYYESGFNWNGINISYGDEVIYEY